MFAGYGFGLSNIVYSLVLQMSSWHDGDVHILKVILSLSFCLIMLFVPGLIYLAKFNNQGPVGRLVKSRLLQFPPLVSLFNLNEPGDGRYMYINRGLPTIKVNVVYAANNQPSPDINGWIEEMIGDTIKKPVEVSVADNSFTAPKEFNTKHDLNLIRLDALNSHPNRIDLLIVYLPYFEEKPSYAGITLHRDTIFIFKNALTDLLSKPDELAKLEKSTLMHEWGHLLGMEHNDFESCIMAKSAEIYEVQTYRNRIATSYCWDEVYQFQQLHQLSK